MANQETQLLDEIIATSRRKMLTLGVASLAGLAVAGLGVPSAEAAASYTDSDILNFALNLEYLEANFYYLAAFGTTIDVANAASTAAGAPQITLSGTVGTPGTVSGGSQVPFTTIPVASYAIETAVEEGKHVQLLLSCPRQFCRRPACHQPGHVLPDARHGGEDPGWCELQPLCQR